MTQYDIIISGCGPTGGVLACLLARRGLSVCVVEKYAEVYPMPRAIVLDWEVMRALQSCGVAERLYPGTKPHPGTDFLGLDGQIIKLFDPLPPPHDLGWPATLTFIQPELEGMLRDRLSELPEAKLKFGASVTDFAETAEGVQVTVTHGTGETEQITGRYLVGCDGANSVIRTQMGLPLEDLEFDEWWVVVDAWQRRETPLRPKTTQYCWPSRPATYVVGPGDLRRWELKLLPGEAPEDFADTGKLREVMRPYVDVDAFELWRHAAYRFSARVGAQWSKGRVLLAGDAVHQTPPFLGQGLCAGIRDAYNLAWKLAMVVQGEAAPALLETYEQERRPHVGKIIAHAKEFGLIIGEMDIEKARIRDAELGAQLKSGKMVTSRQGFIPDLVSGVISKADASGLAGRQMVQPRVLSEDGREVLLDDLVGESFVFLTAGAAPQDWAAPEAQRLTALGIRRISLDTGAAQLAGVLSLRVAGDTLDRWIARTGCQAVILRPDRYIFAAVEGPEALAGRLDELEACLSRVPQGTEARRARMAQ